MNREQITKKSEGNSLYTLMPLEEFKNLMGIDDREDRLARFCLVTSTCSIEQYCKRKFLLKKYFENIEFFGDLVVTLKEYPVSEVLAVYAIGNNREQRKSLTFFLFCLGSGPCCRFRRYL
jgi:hypothetical protein